MTAASKLLLKEEISFEILSSVGPLREKFIFFFSLGIAFVLRDRGLFVNIQSNFASQDLSVGI